MKPLLLRRAVLGGALACCTWSLAFGQAEKITLRRAPEPNQTVRFRAVQDIQMEMTVEGDVAQRGGAPQPTKMGAKAISAYVQRTSPVRANGSVQSEVTIEESRTESTLGPPPANDNLALLTGKKFTVTFDREGNAVDVQFPPGTGLPGEAFNQLVKSVSGTLPSAMAVGEVATMPLDLPLALPMTNGAPVKMNGQTQYKLVSVDKGATGRIARFDVTMNGTMVSAQTAPAPQGRIDMNMDMVLSGTGIVLQNLDRGLTQSSEIKTSFGGKIKMSAPGQALPTMNVRMTLTQTMTSN